jgi:hypothetical protein
VVLACIGLSGIVKAAPVSWSNSSGSSADFSWTNGANDNGLAGDPIFNNGVYAFFPSLKAVTMNGADGSASEVIHVTLIPAAGKRISSVSGDFFGDATAGDASSAGYTATLDAKKHGTSTHVSNTLTPPDITTQGVIADHMDLSVPNGYGKVDLSLSLDLHATGRSALAELKAIKLTVDTAPVNAVPLPAALFTFPGAAVVAAIAKRRMTKRA